jgi:hypothetical protein
MMAALWEQFHATAFLGWTPGYTSFYCEIESFEGYRSVKWDLALTGYQQRFHYVDMSVKAGATVSPRDLLAKLGVSNAASAQWEAGETSADVLARISDMFASGWTPVKLAILDAWTGEAGSAEYVQVDLFTSRLSYGTWSISYATDSGIVAASDQVSALGDPAPWAVNERVTFVSGTPLAGGVEQSQILFNNGLGRVASALEEISMSRADFSINNGASMYSVKGGARTD